MGELYRFSYVDASLPTPTTEPVLSPAKEGIELVIEIRQNSKEMLPLVTSGWRSKAFHVKL